MLRFEAIAWTYALWGLPLVALFCWFNREIRGLGARVVWIACRMAAFAAILLALARPVVERASEERRQAAVVALIDVSGSIGDQIALSQTKWRSLEAALPTEVRRECVFFAGRVGGNETGSESSPNETDIEAALDWAAAQLAGNDGHIVLFSDGQATRGDALAAASRARKFGLSVSAVPAGQRQGAPPQIAGVNPPDDARIGVPANMLVRLRADSSAMTNVILLNSQNEEMGRVRALLSDDTVVAIPFTPRQRGTHEWSVALHQAAGPPLDAAKVTFPVAGPPAFLVCDPDPLSVAALQQVLAGLGFECRVALPADMPSNQDELSAYDAVVLSDWPTPPGSAQLEALEKYVRGGGGLIFIGGARVSTKQWHAARLEGLLPIEFAEEKVRGPQQQTPVHVCFVLDVSGSMLEPLGNDGGRPVTKFEMMRSAVLKSLDALPETAVVTVIVFSATHQVVLDAVPIAQRDVITQRVRGIGVGGGTNMAPAIVNAVQILNRSEAARHLILLTDGISAENPTKEVLDWLRASKIALTAVAVGADSNAAILRWMARTTQGVYYHCVDATAIPRVFVNQAQAIKALVETAREPVQPRPGPQPELLRGLTVEEWPILDAALPARQRRAPGVETVLITDQDQPLLAAWRVGLGQVIAFLSDAKPVWARRWMEWAEFERFWGRLFRRAMPDPAVWRAQLDVRREGDNCVVLLAAYDQQQRVPVDVVPEAELRIDGDPASPPIRMHWRRVSAGVFEGRATVQPDARYVGTVFLRQHDGTERLRRQFLFSGDKDAELRNTGPDRRSLEAIAAAGGGQLNPSPEQFRGSIQSSASKRIVQRTPLWPWLLGLALVLWPFDILSRRLAALFR